MSCIFQTQKLCLDFAITWHNYFDQAELDRMNSSTLYFSIDSFSKRVLIDSFCKLLLQGTFATLHQRAAVYDKDRSNRNMASHGNGGMRKKTRKEENKSLPTILCLSRLCRFNVLKRDMKQERRQWV